ncbi:MAG TPA: glycosyltransferase family 4 protein [Burkholderiaceae bacterium]|nr:glycosyltransferase family 4 protein [Burkholderiaceae bacterium]
MLEKVTWSADYSAGEKVAAPLLDPHFAFYLASHRPRRLARDYAAVVAATGPMAAAFTFADIDRPILQLVDATCAVFRDDFHIANIRQGRLDAEARHFSRVSHSFALSNWARRSLVEDYGIAPERVTVLPPFVNLYPPRRAPLYAGHRRLRVGFIGSDFERKGGQALLRWQREELHRYVELHIVAPRVFHDATVPHTHWHGSLANDRVVTDFLPSIDILCHPTRRDCSALVVVEAAAAGVPSVASNVGGIADLIDHGCTGMLLHPCDELGFREALRQLSDTPALLQSMSRAAHARARSQHSSERFLRTVEHAVGMAVAAHG